MGKAISLRVQSLRAQARKVVKQIETPRSPDPIMRRPCADREEKRATREERDGKTRKEHLDYNHPNQRGSQGADHLSSKLHERLSPGCTVDRPGWPGKLWAFTGCDTGSRQKKPASDEGA